MCRLKYMETGTEIYISSNRQRAHLQLRQGIEFDGIPSTYISVRAAAIWELDGGVAVRNR